MKRDSSYPVKFRRQVEELSRTHQINVWTPYGSVDASAKRCEALRSEGASTFSRREYSVYVPPKGRSFTPYVWTLKNDVMPNHLASVITIQKDMVKKLQRISFLPIRGTASFRVTTVFKIRQNNETHF